MRYYAVKIKDLWPIGSKEHDILQEKAYCGLSLSNPNFYGKRLDALIDFLTEHFDQTLLITTGYVYRLHYRLFIENDDKALEYALSKEKHYINEELLPSLERLKKLDRNRLKFINWQDISLNSKFEAVFSQVLRFYTNEIDFKDDIEMVAKNFVEHKLKKVDSPLCCSEAEAIKLSTDFLLEETAVFEYLVNEGYKVDVYPGIALPALRNIAKFSNAPIGLKHRKALELDILKRGKNREKIANKAETATN